jgi:beta-galactosidase
MAFKSGFCDENSTVRAVTAPGPLREACGFSYQEFTTLKQPLALKGDPFKAGPDNRVSLWAKFLHLETCRALAAYDHPVFGAYPAVTRNEYGRGVLTYEGTVLTDGLQDKVVADCLARAGLRTDDENLPAGVKAKHAVLADGAACHAYFNFSAERREFTYGREQGRDLLTGAVFRTGGRIALAPWDCVLVRVER